MNSDVKKATRKSSVKMSEIFISFFLLLLPHLHLIFHTDFISHLKNDPILL